MNSSRSLEPQKLHLPQRGGDRMIRCSQRCRTLSSEQMADRSGRGPASEAAARSGTSIFSFTALDEEAS